MATPSAAVSAWVAARDRAGNTTNWRVTTINARLKLSWLSGNIKLKALVKRYRTMVSLQGYDKALNKKRNLVLKKIFGVLLVIFLGLGAFVALGPFLTLNGIENSFQNENAEELSRYVDFPTLRENIKSQLDAQLEKRSTSGSWGATMATNWAAALAARLINGLVTPAGLELLLSGQHLQTSEEPTSENNDVRSALKDAEFSYHSDDTFYVYISMQNGKKVQATLTREDLTWKLTNVELNR